MEGKAVAPEETTGVGIGSCIIMVVCMGINGLNGFFDFSIYIYNGEVGRYATITIDVHWC